MEPLEVELILQHVLTIFSIVFYKMLFSRTFYLQNLALTSPTSGGRSVGIVCSRTKATEFSVYVWCLVVVMLWDF
jgi:hypothetical protein